jgi:exonuclease VII large subunit
MPALLLLVRDKTEHFSYTLDALHGVRRRSTPAPRASAHEIHVPKTVELEQRIARLELKLQRACEDLEKTRQRMSALQAQLDHYGAKFGRL